MAKNGYQPSLFGLPGIFDDPVPTRNIFVIGD